jgi:predicted tellurium resistance membrane protein TerC
VHFTPELLVALLTLSTLEIVLGVDNLVFISIAVGRLPPEMRPNARRLGLALACLTRICLLLVLAHLAAMDDKRMHLFTLFQQTISVRDLIMIGGGVFLIVKGTMEIYDAVYNVPEPPKTKDAAAAFVWVILQIAIIDIVFSLDSVITAVGMANHLSIMVTAMVIAMLVMLVSAGGVSRFIDQHPSLKILALAFLLLIGVMLVAEGMGTHVEKGYIYFAMAFSLLVEMLNMRYRRRRSPR